MLFRSASELLPGSQAGASCLPTAETDTSACGSPAAGADRLAPRETKQPQAKGWIGKGGGSRPLGRREDLWAPLMMERGYWALLLFIWSAGTLLRPLRARSFESTSLSSGQKAGLARGWGSLSTVCPAAIRVFLVLGQAQVTGEGASMLPVLS